MIYFKGSSRMLKVITLAGLLLLSNIVMANDSGVKKPLQQTPAMSADPNAVKNNYLPPSKPKLSISAEAHSKGLNYFNARRFNEAEPLFKKAYENAFTALEKAQYANELGNLYRIGRNNQAATYWYNHALELAANDHSLIVAVGLNLTSMYEDDYSLSQLERLLKLLQKVEEDEEKIRYAITLGAQASQLAASEKVQRSKAVKVSYDAFTYAHAIAAKLGDSKYLAQTFDGLSQLYEQDLRNEEGLEYADRAALQAQQSEAHDLLIGIEWRRGRLLKTLGKPDLALRAYQRAVDHIEAIRQDIPIDYVDGNSSFRTLLEPVYLGLADLLLSEADNKNLAVKSALYRRTQDTLELMKQSELEDFLGDRCIVDSVTRTDEKKIPAHTAIIYPVVLTDRLELLVQTSNGFYRRVVSVSADVLNPIVVRFSKELGNKVSDPHENARQLYDWILGPVKSILEEAKIETIIFVPDGKLRLLPIAALHDGKQFIIQKYAVATIPGLTLTNSEKRISQRPKILLAGLSEVGSVVNKLPGYSITKLTTGIKDQPSTSVPLTIPRGSRSVAHLRSSSIADKRSIEMTELELKTSLALPGVEDEIKTLHKDFKGEVLLNRDFTLARFKKRVIEGDYNIIHIASHGFFGNTAQSSFIMAYDDVLTIEGLQGLLQTRGLSEQPVDLLTLSACQTAEGDDRAPLGFVGAALKANARSALGTLWAVEDNAAKLLMPTFYQALMQPGITKIKALQKAQLSLMNDSAFTHPYFWAPFILVGNWQ